MSIFVIYYDLSRTPKEQVGITFLLRVPIERGIWMKFTTRSIQLKYSKFRDPGSKHCPFAVSIFFFNWFVFLSLWGGDLWAPHCAVYAFKALPFAEVKFIFRISVASSIFPQTSWWFSYRNRYGIFVCQVFNVFIKGFCNGICPGCTDDKLVVSFYSPNFLKLRYWQCSHVPTFSCIKEMLLSI